jgi:hypothetical protein
MVRIGAFACALTIGVSGAAAQQLQKSVAASAPCPLPSVVASPYDTATALRSAGFGSAQVDYLVSTNDIRVTWTGDPRLDPPGNADRAITIVWTHEHVTFNRLILTANGSTATYTYAALAALLEARPTGSVTASIHDIAQLGTAVCGIGSEIDKSFRDAAHAAAIWFLTFIALVVAVGGISAVLLWLTGDFLVGRGRRQPSNLSAAGRDDSTRG